MIKINENLTKIGGSIVYPDSFNYLKHGEDFHAHYNKNGDIIVESVLPAENLEIKLKEWQKQNPQPYREYTVFFKTENGKICFDRFMGRTSSGAIKDFRDCYRHGTYTVVEALTDEELKQKYAENLSKKNG